MDKEGIATVENEDGFEEQHPFSELLLRATMARELSKGVDNVTLEDIGESKLEKQVNRSLKTRKDMGVWEVDLHIQELVDNSYGMEKYQLLQIQLDHFTVKLDEAISVGMKKIIFIHGRGTGRLRKALKEILTRYPNCESLDGDYNRYGVGAMEVRIKYRPQKSD